MLARTMRIAVTALGLALPISAPALALPPPGQLPPGNMPATNTLPGNGTVKLSIPIKLNDIPSAFQTFSLQCSFRYASGTGWGNGSENARVDLPLSNGSYSGTLTETLTLQSSTASMVNGYQCNLFLFSATGGTVPSATNPNPLARPQPNTPFLSHVEGGF
jgi:hypothetical protein